MKKLDDIETGKTVTVDSFSDENLALKLMEMGCLPGEKVCIERKAPMGDPIAISVSGYLLSLRKSEAKTILVNEYA